MSTETKPKPERKLRADAERNRVRILEAASQVFAERGLAVTMDDIAEAAGVGVGTVYRRFPDKSDLIDAIFEARIDELVGYAEEGLESEDPWEGFAYFIEHACAMHASDRALRQLIFGSGQGRGFLDRGLPRIVPLATELIARAQASGDLRDDIVAFDMPMIQMAIIGPTEFIGDAAPDIWRRSMALMLDGLRASGKGRSELPGPPLDPRKLGRAVDRGKR